MDMRLVFRIIRKSSVFRTKKLSFSESRRLLSSRSSKDKKGVTSDPLQHSSADKKKGYRDPLPYFLNYNVQELLIRLTEFNPERAAAYHRTNRLGKAKYAFVTDQLLKQMQESFQEKETKKILNMPPAMKPWETKDEVLAKNEEIAGLYVDKFVFTDISEGIPNKKRLLVVREQDGTLRKAYPEERDRILQVYYPVPGKSIHPPKMFEDENLLKLMDEDKHNYIMDKACAQFEPNDPRYIAVAHKVYEHINNNNNYDSLRFTRHFGPMVFHYAWNFKVTGLLRDMVEKAMLYDAVDLIGIVSLIFNNKKININVNEIDNYSAEKQIYIIQKYVQDHVHKSQRGPIQLAVQAIKASLEQKEAASR